jgi:hypothetical protein
MVSLRAGRGSSRSGDFGQGRLDMVGGRELGARERRGDQGVVREQIDLARQAGGPLEERFFGGGLEEGVFGAREAEPMCQIGGELVACERGHVVADDDALAERLVHGHGEAPAQLRMADQHETEPVLGVHLVVGQQPEIFEDIRPQMVGFIDHEDRASARVGTEA